MRLGDLDPRDLRHPEAQGMVAFARRLYEETDGLVRPGADHWSRLWGHVVRILTLRPSG